MWHTAPVQSLEEAKTRQLVVGGTSVGGNGIDMAIIMRDVFGYKLKIVSGYKTSAETKIALERGEIEGTLGNAWSSLNQTDWLARKLVRVIVQHGSRKHRELPDVPLFKELARSTAEAPSESGVELPAVIVPSGPPNTGLSLASFSTVLSGRRF